MTISKLYEHYTRHPKICTDTRKIVPDCLFFALKGENFDANTFAEKALEMGAAFAVIDNVKFKKNEQYLVVDDTLIALQQLAKYHRNQLKIPVIGLTGSNGKTTTKELVNSVLSQKFNTLATVGNLNNHIGVPLTLLEISKENDIAIIEMGANHQNEIGMLSEICKPDFGLITNIGKAHLEGFGGISGIKKGKGELYDFLSKNNGVVFVNKDSIDLAEMAANRKFKEVVFYGNDIGNDISGKLLKNNPYLEIEWTHQGQSHQVISQLTGSYNFENVLAAIAIGLRFGLSPDEVNKGISDYHPQNNRSQIIKTNSNTIICDFYNANPSSMEVAIENINQLKAENKVLILGDMYEVGDDTFIEHENIVNASLSKGFNQVIFVGAYFYQHQNDKGLFFKETLTLKEYLTETPFKGSLILVKGSRGMKLESLMEYL